MTSVMCRARHAQPVPGSDRSVDRPTPPGAGAAGGDLRAGTSEPGDPLLPGHSRGQTLWWRYAAPGAGRVRIEASTNAVVPLVVVYRETALGGLELVADNEAAFTSACYSQESRLRATLAFEVAAGGEYALVADWNDLVPPVTVPRPPAGGPFELSFAFVPAPANDHFANAEPLSGPAVQARAALFAATGEPGEPLHGGNPGGRSVWFTWTAPETGQVEITPGQARVYPPPAAQPGPLAWADRTELARAWSLLGEDWSLPPGYGSVFTTGGGGGGITDFCAFYEQDPLPAFYPVFGVYEGEGPTLQPVAGGTNLNFFVFGGTTLRIAVAGNAGTGEDIDFQVRLTPRAVNVEFAERIPLPGQSAEAVGHTMGTGWPFGGTPTPGFVNQPRAWWTWSAPAEGPVWLATVISDRRVGFGVFTGDDPTLLRELASGETAVTFYAQRGVSYQISTALTDAPGELRFSLRHLPSRLRAALVTGPPTNQGLLLAEADAPRILVQLAGALRWRDAAFAVPPAGLPATATGYLLPLGSLVAEAAPGRARVWLLDFPLPAVGMLPPHAELVRAGAGYVEVAGVPAQRVEVETSTDLATWSPRAALTLDTFFGYFEERFPTVEGGRFYRAREVTLEVRSLRPDGP